MIACKHSMFPFSNIPSFVTQAFLLLVLFVAFCVGPVWSPCCKVCCGTLDLHARLNLAFKKPVHNPAPWNRSIEFDSAQRDIMDVNSVSKRDELGLKFKVSELQQELGIRGLDTEGKKSELVDRLWDAMESERLGLDPEPAADPVAPKLAVDAPEEAEVLLAQLKMLKEREIIVQRELSLKAEQSRLSTRREQVDLELRLVKLGHMPPDSVSDEFKVETAVSRIPETTTDALAAQVQRSLLPPAEITPFSGNVQEYPLFVRAFESRIASKTQSPDELIFYLQQYTRSKPRQIVNSCLALGLAGYTEAMKLLQQRYAVATDS